MTHNIQIVITSISDGGSNNYKSVILGIDGDSNKYKSVILQTLAAHGFIFNILLIIVYERVNSGQVIP